CNYGYKKSDNNCIKKISIPANAYATALEPDGWKCKSGYTKSGNYCVDVPDNAYASGSGWQCNSGYAQYGNSCVTVTNLADNTMEVEFWESIRDTNDPEEYRIYLEEYPAGKFAKLAELRINKLDSTTISVAQASTSTPNFNYGNYHALVIGNDRYRHLPQLSNAVNDANDVASLLRSKYRFNVDLLTNATRNEIVSALYSLNSKISEQDNLLVYYAGHGELNKNIGEGYWLPVDAVDDNPVNWISNSTIISSVKGMKAKHVMVVADSCFSGALTRGVKIMELSPDYIKKIVEKKARTVLTSGGEEP
ncbi:MAG: caspase family protein, partial [Anaerolineales bacterium]|nr:caspase family protein [Anaerolineales bacterium]